MNGKKMIFEYINISKPLPTSTGINLRLTLDLNQVFFNHCKSLYSIATFSHYKQDHEHYVALII